MSLLMKLYGILRLSNAETCSLIRLSAERRPPILSPQAGVQAVCADGPYHRLARDIALAIRAKIKEVTGLNASAGISYNKFLAKLASDHRKPNGQYVITPEMGPAFVEALPVGKFHGIGPATSAKMNSLGLQTGLDMRNQTLDFMQTNFGQGGSYYYWVCRGVDHREVRANRIRKSVGAENTFSVDLTEFEAMAAELRPLIDKVWHYCEEKGTRGRTVTLKVKFADFEISPAADPSRPRFPLAVTSRDWQ
jgi:DNA polymerase-4